MTTRPAVTSVAVAAQGLTRRFGDKIAVDAVDLEIPAGSFYGICGPNGAGKTTSLRMMTGLLRPDAGVVRVEGLDVWADPVAAKAVFGVVPDVPRLFERLSGLELLEFTGLLRDMPPDVIEARADELLRILELEADAATLVADYSLGMRKKVAIACAILHNPTVLFLDEPFGSIDPVSTQVIEEILTRFITSGGTVVFSSHVMDVVERLCDRIVVIDRGRIVSEGAVADITAGRRLQEVFVELVGGRGDLEDGELGWLGSSSD